MLPASHLARTLCISLVIALLIGACGGLGGEPQIVATLVLPTETPPETGHPTNPPDLAAGAEIYALRCASCHGINGQGNGELVTSGQLVVDGEVQHPGNFTDPATAREQTPQEWFNTITNGRIEHLMPPWADALTEQERWDVALYTYTMHYTPEQITRGLEIWESECVDCHGMEGRGDGPEAEQIERRVVDLTDQEEMAIVSDKVIYNFIYEGSADTMPAFSESLSEEQIWDVVAYGRTLSLQNTEVIGAQPPDATPESTVTAGEEAASDTVTGRITNGTAGGTVPSELPVVLFTIDSEFSSQRYNTISDPEGNFTFSDIPISPDLSYAATVTYRDRAFASDVITGGTSTMTLPVTIYELTEDPAVITITGLVHQVSAVGDGLQVAQVMIFDNNSDRLFTSSQAVNDNQFASVVITLPPGAVVLGFPDDQQRYVVSDDQTTIVDTVPIAPGRDHIVQVVYFLPYEGSAIIEQPMNYALDGPVRLLLRPATVSVTSEQLPSIGEQTVGDGAYSGYGAELTLSAGEVIRYELNGRGATTGDQLEPQVVSSNNLGLVIMSGLIVLAVFMVAALYTINRRARLVSPTQQDKQLLMDTLLRQIAELDEAEARGDINHDLYHNQRKQLKTRLAELMNEKD